MWFHGDHPCRASNGGPFPSVSYLDNGDNGQDNSRLDEHISCRKVYTDGLLLSAVRHSEYNDYSNFVEDA